MPHRPERLAEMLREELTDLISGEVADPRVGLAQITEIKVAPNLHQALVYVGVMGGAEQERHTLAGLMSARGFLRAQLAQRLQIRQMPELRFEIDRSEELESRLDTLLRRDRKKHPKTAN